MLLNRGAERAPGTARSIAAQVLGGPPGSHCPGASVRDPGGLKMSSQPARRDRDELLSPTDRNERKCPGPWQPSGGPKELCVCSGCWNNLPSPWRPKATRWAGGSVGRSATLRTKRSGVRFPGRRMWEATDCRFSPSPLLFLKSITTFLFLKCILSVPKARSPESRRQEPRGESVLCPFCRFFIIKFIG